MRSFTPLTAFGIACFVVIAGSPVFANIIVTADEFGNGTWGGAKLSWSKGTDPTAGGVIGEDVLIYELPSGVHYAGDVVLTKPGQNNVISGILRFWNVPNDAALMLFYSDGTNGKGSSADVSGVA